MTISIKNAFKNVFSDREFITKYTYLVVLSFCIGFMNFALLAKNYALLPIAIILAVLSSVINYGYDIEYIKALMADEQAKLPEWTDNIKKFFLIGIKYFAAIMLIGIVFSLVLTILMLFGMVSAYLTHQAALIKILPKALFVLIEIFTIICAPGFIYLFIESDNEIASLFNFKKLFSYLGLNYFTAISAMAILVIVNGIIAAGTSANIKYALLYIIPLMIAPIFKLGTDNLIAQAYVEIKNRKKGSLLKFILYTIIMILLLLLAGVLAIKFGIFKTK